MLIGSNNSFSYLKPVSILDRLTWFLHRCQDIDYVEQYEKWNVRLFDVKIYFDTSNKVYFKNGNVTYVSPSIHEVLDYFNSKGDVKLIVTLEETEQDVMLYSTDKMIERFKKFCKMIETAYPNIVCYGGRRSRDGIVLYEFENNSYEQPCLDDGNTKKWYIKRFPFIAKYRNFKVIWGFKSKKDFLMLNFINHR